MASTIVASALALFAVGLAVAALPSATHAVSLVQVSVDASHGDIAYPGQFPWHAAVRKTGNDGNTLLGSGALVSQQYVLTAASIIPQETDATLEVIVGAVSLGHGGKTVTVKEVKKHPEWSSGGPSANDLGLLLLDTSVILPNDKTIELALLPPFYYRRATYKNERLTVTSYGANTPESSDMYLRAVVTKVLSNRDCSALRGGKVGPAQLCAMQDVDEDTEDFSLGTADGGDPAVFTETSGKVRLVGIVSQERQSNKVKPTVLARITEHLNWIQENSDARVEG